MCEYDDDDDDDDEILYPQSICRLFAAYARKEGGYILYRLDLSTAKSNALTSRSATFNIIYVS